MDGVGRGGGGVRGWHIIRRGYMVELRVYITCIRFTNFLALHEKSFHHLLALFIRRFLSVLCRSSLTVCGNVD